METNEARLQEAALRRRLVLLAAGSSCLPGWAGAAGAEKAPVEVQVSHLRTLHHFSGADGSGPRGGLTVADDGWLHGCTEHGGAHRAGALYAISHRGDFVLQGSLEKKNGGGREPWGGLVQGSDGSFYGTTHAGGVGYGTVFRVQRDGSPLTLHSFALAEGSGPAGSLMQGTDGNFYGTTCLGGLHLRGTCYSITLGGVMTPLYSFGGSNGGGIYPLAGLVQGSDGNLYGTTNIGGVHGVGTVFRLDAAGVKTTLYSFRAGDDGSRPQAELVEGPDGLLYGTTWYTAFRLRKDGGEFEVLHAFGGTADGDLLAGPLLPAADGYLYGTARAGGDAGLGTLFRLDADGRHFKRLHSFSGADGAGPAGALVQGGRGRIYGTTRAGGASNLGTVFRLHLG